MIVIVRISPRKVMAIETTKQEDMISRLGFESGQHEGYGWTATHGDVIATGSADFVNHAVAEYVASAGKLVAMEAWDKEQQERHEKIKETLAPLLLQLGYDRITFKESADGATVFQFPE